MRWYSESPEVRIARERAWHRWYAWHPIRVGEQLVWLEIVERKITPVFEGEIHDYRLIEKPPVMPRKDMA